MIISKFDPHRRADAKPGIAVSRNVPAKPEPAVARTEIAARNIATRGQRHINEMGK